jgi:hypothetical protein
MRAEALSLKPIMEPAHALGMMGVTKLDLKLLAIIEDELKETHND